jgi:hypothetical protein
LRGGVNLDRVHGDGCSFEHERYGFEYGAAVGGADRGCRGVCAARLNKSRWSSISRLTRQEPTSLSATVAGPFSPLHPTRSYTS